MTLPQFSINQLINNYIELETPENNINNKINDSNSTASKPIVISENQSKPYPIEKTSLVSNTDATTNPTQTSSPISIKSFYPSLNNDSDRSLKVIDDIDKIDTNKTTESKDPKTPKKTIIKHGNFITTSAILGKSSITIKTLIKPSPSDSSTSIPLKRRRENTVEDLSVENLTENKSDTSNNNSQQIVKSIITTTPNRRKPQSTNRYNLNENRENCGGFNWDSPASPVKKWNRTNSNSKSSTSFGGNKTAGFSNLGNTCYMNAILQCLLNIDVFSSELLSNYDLIKRVNQLLSKREDESHELDQESSKDEKENNMNCVNSINDTLYLSFCELLKARESKNTNDSEQINQSLKDVKSFISKESMRFCGYEQNDAHEFMCHVLDLLKDDFEKYYKKYNENKALIIKNLLISNLKIEFKLTNPIVDNFQFIVRHSIECTSCSNVTTKEEEYYNLCLELPQLKDNLNNDSLSIQRSLDTFFKEEIVTDFKCEKCDKKKEVRIRRHFSKLPRVLILYLKRYQIDEIKRVVPVSSNSSENLLSNIEGDEENSKPPAPATKTVVDFRFVKNDSKVKITRFIGLKHLSVKDEELKLPHKIDKDIIKKYSSKKLDEIIVSPPQQLNHPHQNSSSKTPLKISLNNENNIMKNNNSPYLRRETRSSSTMLSSPYASIRINSPSSTRRQTLSRLNENNLTRSSKSKRNIQQHFSNNNKDREHSNLIMDQVDIDDDEDEKNALVNIEEPFDNSNNEACSKQRYDLKDFVPDSKMSDEDQLQMALKQSMSFDNGNEVLYLDGAFDGSDGNDDEFEDQNDDHGEDMRKDHIKDQNDFNRSLINLFGRNFGNLTFFFMCNKNCEKI